MAFKVALEFDAADDLFALLVKFAVPNPSMGLIAKSLQILEERLINMSAAFDALKAEVAATRGALDSATTLIAGIAARIEENREDPEALLALAAGLRQDREELAAAVAADQAGPVTEPAPVDEAAPTENEGTPPDADQPAPPVVVPPTV